MTSIENGPGGVKKNILDRAVGVAALPLVLLTVGWIEAHKALESIGKPGYLPPKRIERRR